MKMREYTQEEIDNILNAFDPEKPEHKLALQDIIVIWNIDNITQKRYGIDAVTLTDRANELVNYFRSLDSKRGKRENGMLGVYFDLISLIKEENKLQGIATYDFERNIWRLAYVFKSTQYAEEMAIQNKEIVKPIDLVKNFKDDDIENFNATYTKLITHYVNTQALIGYLNLLKEKTKIADIQRFIDKLEFDLDLVDILEEEAKLTQTYITEYLKRNVKAEELSAPTREELDEQANRLIDELLEKYKPLLHVPDLKVMKLTNSAYLRIRKQYEKFTVKELLERKQDIQNDFKDVLFNDYAER